MRWTPYRWRRGPAEREAAPGPAERVVVVRARLDRLALDHLELLADESVPGRKHRFDAIAAARADLEAELRGLERRLDPDTEESGAAGLGDRR